MVPFAAIIRDRMLNEVTSARPPTGIDTTCGDTQRRKTVSSFFLHYIHAFEETPNDNWTQSRHIAWINSIVDLPLVSNVAQ